MTNPMRLPKSGARIGDRTVIRTYPDYGCRKGEIIFGLRERGVDNCGAYVTSIEEWREYEASLYEDVP